jgi:hypothetical protein
MADSFPEASLCPKCARLFEGTHIFGCESVVFESPATNLVTPRICRLCSVISSRHERFVTKHNSLPELNMCEVHYYYLRISQDDAGYQVKSAEIRLLLYYSEGMKEAISLAAMPVDSKQALMIHVIPR